MATGDPCGCGKGMLGECRYCRADFAPVITWRPSVPLPLYKMFGRCKCECGLTFRNESRYRSHWVQAHAPFVGLDHPLSSTGETVAEGTD